MAGIKYDIVKHFGTISTSKSGWKKELNLVSWNEREPKFDIREWDPEYQKMGKGLTFTKEELIELKELLNNIDLK
ncbi:hypothetical protein EXD82_05085 [Peptacetobacter hominis]|uniref:Transcriptional coactivator p15 (PC4) C-terminal domain-containing protein n=1 Tax=Peptacetobacter hominis TaxID=2743610 RepID=A0A544QVQ5_9FIRM|nr:PC4/YdbC family ssDNA-binding protein [Peptacetobacter hominis]TQQ84779.1 hypothetical protein EXD82_05085 [Peptacetobacter hominis]